MALYMEHVDNVMQDGPVAELYPWGYNSTYLDVSKNRGKKPKMDGENNGKPY